MESVLTTLQQNATNHEIKLANLFQSIFEHLKLEETLKVALFRVTGGDIAIERQIHEASKLQISF